MTRECKREECHEVRRDLRGSGGLFCSDECYEQYSVDVSGFLDSFKRASEYKRDN